MRCVLGAAKIEVLEAKRTVVLPALSRPRKRSLACLFASPSWASMSQTVQRISIHPLPPARAWFCLTPVDDPHGGARS